MIRPTTNSGLLSTAELLERSEIVPFPDCPFSLPAGDDLEFLLHQHVASRGRKDIGFDPVGGHLGGVRVRGLADRARLATILGQFSDSVTSWVQSAFPEYRAGFQRDRVTLRTEEEATRALRLKSRNDLLHIDNFPTRPTNGRRILRVFANIHPTDPHVWATAGLFPDLVQRFAARHPVPARSRADWVAPAPTMLRMFTGGRGGRSVYDAWMLRLHNLLKEDEGFQVQTARKVWTFPTRTAWALFADGVAHAQLRGRFALEHSFFVPVECLAHPAEAPVAVLERTGGEFARRAG